MEIKFRLKTEKEKKRYPTKKRGKDLTQFDDQKAIEDQKKKRSSARFGEDFVLHVLKASRDFPPKVE